MSKDEYREWVIAWMLHGEAMTEIHGRPRSTIHRNLKTRCSQEFWAYVAIAAHEVDNWPAWMRGGVVARRAGCN